MQSAAQIVGEPLWARMADIYREWVREDAYGGPCVHGQAPEPYRVDSVRVLVGEVFAFSAQAGLWQRGARVACTLDMSVRELFACEARADNGQARPIGEVFYLALCAAHLHRLLGEASRFPATAQGDAERAALVAGAGRSSWSELMQHAGVVANAVTLARGLREILLQELSDKRLWHFFEQPVNEHGYRAWWPRAFSGVGEPLKTREVATAGGTVTVKVSRYVEDTDSPIRPYEWQATLRRAAGDQAPLAAACGMVYVLPREDGMLCCSRSDLRWAADAVADVDVSQVLAFLSQHADAEALMARGDLCFLWLWERKDDSAKGLGAEVLEAALRDLKKRFRALKTLVVNVQPAQFSPDALASDPPAVQVAREEACERLERMLERLAPQAWLSGELRLVRSRFLSFEQTLAALGEEDLEDDALGEEDEP